MLNLLKRKISKNKTFSNAENVADEKVLYVDNNSNADDVPASVQVEDATEIKLTYNAEKEEELSRKADKLLHSEQRRLSQGKEKNVEDPEIAPAEGRLTTDNLVKRYGKRTVVNHVSIDVSQGEIVGLLGPNGAGKTTTFYMTVGLIQPNGGRIFLDKNDITKMPVYKRAKLGIGYLAQEASVFRKLSVEDNIRAVLEMTSLSRAQQKDKLESLIREFRLQKVRKNYGDRLSGGERRRTEIARCLAISPKFIMLDEPFAGVDPIAVEDIQSIVYKLKDKNIGILITDHNANETLSITDRAYLLFEGKILFQGTSEELAANPVVRAKYLGRNFEFRRKHFDLDNHADADE